MQHNNTTHSKAKILFVGKLPPPYIGPTVATKIILESELKYQYTLIHLDVSDHRSANTLGRLDIMNLLIAVKQYMQILWVLLRSDIDILYFPSAQTTIAYLRDIPNIVLAKMFSVKVVLHLRGGNFDKWLSSTSAIMRKIVRYCHGKIDAQIVLGDCLRHMFEDIVDESKIFVVPNGMDYKYDKIASNDKIIKVLFLGNFLRTKGVLEFAEAAFNLSKINEVAQFVAVGSFRDEFVKNKLLDYEKKSDGRLTIIGGLIGESKFEMLSTSHIFVFPTYYHNEGHPWVIVEALAAGLPIISTDKGAIIESVIHGYNGYIANKESVENLQMYIEMLLDDESLRLQMGRNSLDLYRSRFTLQHLVANMSNVFESVLK